MKDVPQEPEVYVPYFADDIYKPTRGCNPRHTGLCSKEFAEGPRVTAVTV
jgi:hypothetical protein